MELDLLRETKGYKAILKAVLKTQIQILIEQLHDETGAESIFLTVSGKDGSLSHLGSYKGKKFLAEQNEIKSQFLGYCHNENGSKKGTKHKTPIQQDRSQSIHKEIEPASKRPRIQHKEIDTNQKGREQNAQIKVNTMLQRSASALGDKKDQSHNGSHSKSSITPGDTGSKCNDPNRSSASVISALETGKSLDTNMSFLDLQESNEASTDIGFDYLNLNHIQTTSNIRSSDTSDSIQTQPTWAANAAPGALEENVEEGINEGAFPQPVIKVENDAAEELELTCVSVSEDADYVPSDPEEEDDSKFRSEPGLSEEGPNCQTSDRREKGNKQKRKLCSNDPQRGTDDIYSEGNYSTMKADINIADGTSAKLITGDSQSGETKSSAEADQDILNAVERSNINDQVYESDVEADAMKEKQQVMCEICAKQFRDRRGLRRHQLTCSLNLGMESVSVGSKQIDEKFASEVNSYTEADGVTSENINNKHSCNKCAHVFYNRNALSRHLLSCQRTLSVPCPNCDMVFSQIGHLKVHFLSHVSQPSESFPCPNCDQVFGQIGHLKVHFLTHLDAVLVQHRIKEVKSQADRLSGEFRCDYITSDGSTCNKLFALKWSLERHMDTHFDRIKPFACSECSKRYYQKSHLQEHVEMAHSQSSKTYPCPKCKKMFKHMKSLNSHKLRCRQNFQ